MSNPAKSGDVTWVDPLVGLRLRHQFVPGQELTLSGDAGGFSAGSEFSWQAVGAYRFQIGQARGATWSGMPVRRDVEAGFGLPPA